jgi:hypothetical protein
VAAVGEEDEDVVINGMPTRHFWMALREHFRKQTKCSMASVEDCHPKQAELPQWPAPLAQEVATAHQPAVVCGIGSMRRLVLQPQRLKALRTAQQSEHRLSLPRIVLHLLHSWKGDAPFQATMILSVVALILVSASPK